MSVVERAGLRIGEKLAVEVDDEGRVIVSRAKGETVGDRRRRALGKAAGALPGLACGRARRATRRVAVTILDTSVLIALLDPGDYHQAARASLEAHADDDLRIPAHALAEALVHPVRVGKERARRLIASLEIAVDPIDEAVAVAAARLRPKHGGALRMPDALVLAYADVRKVKSLLTADARWAAWSRRVELIST